ncbi:MAG TPA: AAA family ATPase [Methanobacterium sp.]|jgi:hypothetical protein|nr:AAA family ATPase [Methanobacterium sp.]HPX77745.1 AAA family ATPase [Methanobacterium sp.]
MSPRKKRESALGRGLDALIRKDYLDEEEGQPKKTEKRHIKAEALQEEKTEITDEIRPKETKISNMDEKIVDAVLLDVHKNPRISLWSAKSAAVLRFLKKTKPEFSISNEASLLIEEAVKEKYPDMWEIFEDKGL